MCLALEKNRYLLLKSCFFSNIILLSVLFISEPCFKVIRAEEAGAVGVIITDTDEENDDLYISMVDDTTNRNS